MPLRRRPRPAWLVAVAVVALLATGTVSRMHPGACRTPPASRVAASPGHPPTGSTIARPADLQRPSAFSATPHHLDLAATPPTSTPDSVTAAWLRINAALDRDVAIDSVTPHGRGPPAL